MSAIHIVCDYPHPPAEVWRAVTDPELVPRWTATGAGARPEGFAPVADTRFRFVARPRPGWSGVIDCVVLDVDAPRLLRYSWTDHGGGATTEVTYRVEPLALPGGGSGTRFTYDHTGFTGASGLFMARFLGRVRRRMLRAGLPALLDDLAAERAGRRTAQGTVEGPPVSSD